MIKIDEHPNPCMYCKGRLVGVDGRVYTCDNCPVMCSDLVKTGPYHK